MRTFSSQTSQTNKLLNTYFGKIIHAYSYSTTTNVSLKNVPKRLKFISFFKEIIVNIICTNIVTVYNDCPLEHVNLGLTKANKTVDRYLVMVHNRKLIEN